MGVSSVQRINIGFWYQLGAAIRPLLAFRRDSPASEVVAAAYAARQWMDAVINSVMPLQTSYDSAVAFRVALDELIISIDLTAEPAPATIETDRLFAATEAARGFDTVFLAELQRADTYVVSQKGTYSTVRLIFAAEESFIGDAVRAALPEAAKNEIRQWGQCLAFELPTASGFHIMRATEIVILDFLTRVTTGPVKVSPRTWGAYIKALEKAGASEAITSSLHQIRKLHRNPLMHPDDTLDMSKADALFGLAKAAIIAMVTPEALHGSEEEDED
jgi:hypothetical protein